MRPANTIIQSCCNAASSITPNNVICCCWRVLGSKETPNPAPVPKASAPIAASSGPVTAQQATNSPAVPPVSSSASGTVTMNIAMTLYGSSMQPFTSDKQFAAASALAGVSSLC